MASYDVSGTKISRLGFLNRLRQGGVRDVAPFDDDDADEDGIVRF